MWEPLSFPLLCSLCGRFYTGDRGEEMVFWNGDRVLIDVWGLTGWYFNFNRSIATHITSPQIESEKSSDFDTLYMEMEKKQLRHVMVLGVLYDSEFSLLAPVFCMMVPILNRYNYCKNITIFIDEAIVVNGWWRWLVLVEWKCFNGVDFEGFG